MYRRYKAAYPISDNHTTRAGAGFDNIPLPALTSSATDAVMANAETRDILEKIRESVDQEGHGESFVFVILGASVSFSADLRLFPCMFGCVFAARSKTSHPEQNLCEKSMT